MSSTDDKIWMQRAIELALASEREGNLPVGAVVTLDGEAVGEGYSAVLEPEYNPGRHAEVVALRDVDNELWPRAGEMTCYTTLEPCVMCAGTLLLHGIGRVVFGARDRLGGAECILDHLPPYYDEGGVYDWEGPLLPDECDPLYERAHEAFEQLPVGRSQWRDEPQKDREEIVEERRAELDEWVGSGGETMSVRQAREALEQLVDRLEDEQLSAALPYAREIFERGGYLKDFRQLERLAVRAGEPDPFDEVSEAVRDHLPDVWINKAIERGQIERAVDCWFDREQHSRVRLCADELVEVVAADRVQVIISCRLSVVSHLVGRRARRYYRRACDVLRQLRDELERAGATDYWRVVVEDLAERYDNLPAFIDEMEKAGFL